MKSKKYRCLLFEVLYLPVLFTLSFDASDILEPNFKINSFLSCHTSTEACAKRLSKLAESHGTKWKAVNEIGLQGVHTV